MSTPAPKAITVAITFWDTRTPKPIAAPSSSAEPASNPHAPTCTTSLIRGRYPAGLRRVRRSVTSMTARSGGT